MLDFHQHPFVDGHKRTGLIAAIAFLKANGVRTHTTPALYDKLRRLFPSD